MIFFLAKVFKESEHADLFIQGKLHSNTLAYFKDLEDQDGRGDTDEGAIVLQLESLTLQVGIVDPKTGISDLHIVEGLAAPPVLLPQWFDHINMGCMHAAHDADFQYEPAEDYPARLAEHLKIPEKNLHLGKHTVVIKNVTEFFERIKGAANRAGYRIRSGLVTYYDPEIGTPPIQSEIETMFAKRREYDYQREFRFAIDRGSTEGGAITLDVGDISDIAFRTDTDGLSLKIIKTD